MSTDATSLTGGRWRPSGWLVAGLLGGMTVLCALVLVGRLTSSTPGPVPVAVDVVVAVVAVALVPVLLRRPVPTAVVLALLAGLAATATPASTAATLVVARARPIGLASAVAALGTAAHVVRGTWLPLPGLALGWWAVLVVVAHAALLGWGALSQARTAVVLGLAERARVAEADRDRLVAQAVTAERTRIAREMHDVLAHRLSLLATYAGALEYRPDAPPERLAHAAGVVRAGVHQSLEELRDVIGVLREDPAADGVPGPAPGIEQLEDLVAETRGTGTEVELVVALEGAVPGMLARTVFRVVQEGLTNARRHAPGRAAGVRVTGEPGRGLTVEVTNAVGAGDRPDPPGSGTGLLGLEERVRIVGGRLEHGEDRTGFRLSAWLPWPA